MYCWRITKYDPKQRDHNGVYLKKDWTSYYDIGKEFNGSILTIDEYKKWETRYIDAITKILFAQEVEFLKVEGLEKHPLANQLALNNEEIRLFNLIKNNMLISKNEISILARLILREIVWCKLSSSIMYVHFGYDYYMYIGSINSLTKEIEYIKKRGLFVEIAESPYL